MDNEQIERFYRQIRRNAGYLARQEIEKLYDLHRADPKRLEPFGFKVYSQTDEDGIIEEIFRRLGIPRGTFLEIGVEDGLECNSLYLLHKGWVGCWMEGDSKQSRAIADKFSPLLERNRLQLAMGFLTAENINDAVEKLKIDPAALDFLSIDIDGNDIDLLEVLRWTPKVLCIEYNAKFPPGLDKRLVYDPTRKWTGSDYMGASLTALDRVARAKGYTLVGTNVVGANAFFVRSDLLKDQFPSDSSPANLYNPPRYWLVFDHFKAIGHPPDFGPYVDLMES